MNSYNEKVYFPRFAINKKNHMYWLIGLLFLLIPLEGLLLKCANHMFSYFITIKNHSIYFIPYAIVIYTFLDRFKSVCNLILEKTVVSKIVKLWLLFGLVSFIFSPHGELELSLFVFRYVVPFLFSALIINYRIEFNAIAFLVSLGTIIVAFITIYKYIMIFGFPVSGFELVKNKGSIGLTAQMLKYSFISLDIGATSYSILFLVSLAGFLLEKMAYRKHIMCVATTMGMVCCMFLFSRGCLYGVLISCAFIVLVVKSRKALTRFLCGLIILSVYLFVSHPSFMMHYMFPYTLKKEVVSAPAVLRKDFAGLDPYTLKKEVVSAPAVLRKDFAGLDPYSSMTERKIFLMAALIFFKTDKKAVLIGGVKKFNDYMVSQRLMPKILATSALDYSHNLFTSLLINGGLPTLTIVLFSILYSFYLAFIKEKRIEKKILCSFFVAIPIVGVLTGYVFSFLGITLNGLLFWLITIQIMNVYDIPCPILHNITDRTSLPYSRARKLFYFSRNK